MERAGFVRWGVITGALFCCFWVIRLLLRSAPTPKTKATPFVLSQRRSENVRSPEESINRYSQHPNLAKVARLK